MAEEPYDADEDDVDGGEEEGFLPAGGTALIRDRFLVDGSKPLPKLDSPNAKAYQAEDRRDLSRQLFALICTPGLPVRINATQKLKASPGAGVLTLVDWDVQFWQEMDQRTVIIVYERPLGGRVVDQMKSGRGRLTEYDIPQKLVQPAIEGLRHLQTIGVTHRAITPHNFFYMDEDCQEIVLGDCVTSPPGYDQPTMFEPLERAPAPPSGRGKGFSSDDMFSLGASLVVLTLGHNPVERLKGEDLLFRRTNAGSYATICGNARIPIQMLEPLRGLLADNSRERWGLDEMEMWLNGRQSTPMQKQSARKADTPFRFGGRDHTNVRTLAHAFNRQIPDAARTLKDETFHAWLKRSVDAGELSETLKGYVDTANFHKDSFQGSEEYLVARACSAMDIHSPIRYKGISVCADGFGTMLATEYIRGGDYQVLTEIVNRDIHMFWLGDKAIALDHLDAARDITQIKQWLSMNDPGYGIERCIYEMNPGLACRSQLILEDCALEIRDLLPSLDEAAANADTGSRPMDRHIAAFIAARFNEDIHPHLRALASPKDSTNVVGMLSLLAFLQWKLKSDPVYGLSSWVGGVLGPAINSYHSRSTRSSLEKDIPKLVRRGSLPDLFDLIDNAEKRQEDEQGYNDALDEYIACAREIEEIEGTDSALQDKAERTGQKSAAMISVVTTMIAVSIMFISQML